MRRANKRSIPFPAAIALVGILGAAPVAFAADSEFLAMQECKAVQDREERLACYDNISAQPAPEVATVEAPPSAPKAEPVAVPVVEAAAVESATVESAAAEEAMAKDVPGDAPSTLDDSVGRERLGPKDGEQMMVQGRVVSCHENLSSKYVFTFDNGQVWQQKDNKRVPWNECDFEVTITKDFFGYVLQRPGDGKKIRIARVN